MKISYIGNFRPDHSTENDIAKTLNDMGHDVVRIQEDTSDVRAILMLSEGSDLVIYTRTWGIKGDEEILMKTYKERGVTTVSIHLDLYWGLKRKTGVGQGFFWKADYVFSADGGHQKEFKAAGVNHFWLPPGILEDSCYLAEPDRKQFPHQVVFVGSWINYHPEYPERQALVDFLRKTYSCDFEAYGHTNTIRGESLNTLYASARVIVGDCIGSPYYWSDRVTETLGRGGFLLFPETVGLDKYYTAGKHYAEYKRGDHKDLEEKIDAWLNDDEGRKKISKAGQAETKKNNTYKNRLQEVLNTIKL